MNDITPEEKLLNIIRKKDLDKENSNSAESIDINNKPEDVEASKSLSQKREVDQMDSEKKFWESDFYKKLCIKELKNYSVERNDIIFLAIMIIGVIVLNWWMGGQAISYALDNADIKKSTTFVFVDEKGSDSGEKSKKYLSGKDLFTAIQVKPKRRPKKRPDKTVDDIKKNLKLLGIIWDSDNSNPQAIIQSRKSKGTRYVRQGDSIDGAVVEKIDQGHVVISFQGDTADLSL